MKVSFVLTGHPLVVRNLQTLQTVLTRQGNLTAWNGAQHLFARTRAVVPYLNGELYESAYMANIGSPQKKVWVVGYDTAAISYAMTVHETPNRVHPTRGPSSEPKQDHFLSEPRDSMVQSWPKQVREDMQDAIASARFVRAPQRRRR